MLDHLDFNLPLSRRKFMAAGATCVGAAALGGERTQKKPNIVVIVSDDQGYDDLSCYGSKRIETPNLDRIAANGVRCTDFYVSAPLCAPTRSSFMTGRVPQRHGFADRTTTKPLEHGLRKEETLIAEYLKDAGYATAAFGKWNLGFREGVYPTQRGFDEFYGNPSGGFYFFGAGGDADSAERGMYRNTNQIDDRGYGSDLYVDAAIDFLKRNRDKPAFAYVAFVALHVPIGDGRDQPWAPEEDMARFDAQTHKPMSRGWWEANYLASVAAMDRAVGRLLDSIEASGQETLVVFFSDNGGAPHLGARNTPYRGGKKDLAEGGIRVPCVVQWPDALPAGRTCSVPITVMDLFALCMAAADAKMPKPEERIIDGRNPMDALAGRQQELHEQLCFKFRGEWAIRRGDYKLYSEPKKEPRLYDVEKDPGETRDLSVEKPEIAKVLKKKYRAWVKTADQNRK